MTYEKWYPILETIGIKEEFREIVAKYADYSADLISRDTISFDLKFGERNVLPLELQILSKIDLSKVKFTEWMVPNTIFSYQVTDTELFDVLHVEPQDRIMRWETLLIDQAVEYIDEKIAQGNTILINRLIVELKATGGTDSPHKIILNCRFKALKSTIEYIWNPILADLGIEDQYRKKLAEYADYISEGEKSLRTNPNYFSALPLGLKILKDLDLSKVDFTHSKIKDIEFSEIIDVQVAKDMHNKLGIDSIAAIEDILIKKVVKHCESEIEKGKRILVNVMVVSLAIINEVNTFIPKAIIKCRFKSV